MLVFLIDRVVLPALCSLVDPSPLDARRLGLIDPNVVIEAKGLHHSLPEHCSTPSRSEERMDEQLLLVQYVAAQEGGKEY